MDFVSCEDDIRLTAFYMKEVLFSSISAHQFGYTPLKISTNLQFGLKVMRNRFVAHQ